MRPAYRGNAAPGTFVPESTSPGGRWDGAPGAQHEEYGGVRSPRRALAAATIAILLSALAACGGDDGDDSTAVDDLDTSTTEADDAATGDETTTTLTPEAQAWSDLDAGYQTVAALSATPDPASPELERHFTGESLAGFQDTMRDLQVGGAAQTTVTLHQYSVSVGGSSATADYCFVDTTQRLDTAGNLAGPPEVTSMRATSQLELIDGTWKMSRSTSEPEQCPAS